MPASKWTAAATRSVANWLLVALAISASGCATAPSAVMAGIRFAVATTLLVLSGCAGYTVKNDQDALQGIRYYEPAPFLLVYSDGKGNLTSQIIMMPDLTQKRVIDLYAYAAKNKGTLDFENGVLTKSEMTIDSAAVPEALIGTIQTLGVAAIGAAFNAPESGTTRSIPAPYLFKIVVGVKDTTLVGGQGVGLDGKPLVLKIKEANTDTSKAKTETPAKEEN